MKETEEEVECPDFGPEARVCVHSGSCFYFQLCTSIPFFLVAAVATQLWRKLTPVYREVQLEFGSPQIHGIDMNTVDLKIPITFINPNPYPIQVHEKRGVVLLANSANALGHFQIPSAWVPQQSEASFSITSRVSMDGAIDVLAMLPRLASDKRVEFWFVVEEVQAEAKVDLICTELDIAIAWGRACSAKFNQVDKSVSDNMFCSDNLTLLAERIPLLPPEVIATKYEGVKNQTVGTMMAIGYLGGGLFLFLATLTYQNLQDRYQDQEAREACMEQGIPLVTCDMFQEDRENDFELLPPAAVEFYETLLEATTFGGEVQEAIDVKYGNVDWRQYIPRNEDGLLLSVGSIPHLLQPCGTKCSPCRLFQEGRCLAAERCMSCHFHHPRSPRLGNSFPEERRTKKKKKSPQREMERNGYGIASHAATGGA